MIKTIKQFLSSLAVAFMMVVPTGAVLVPATVSAGDTIREGLNCGTELDATSIGTTGGSCPETGAEASGQGLDRVIKLVINIFSLVVGIIAVIMIIVGGLKYITSGGDSGNVSGAKNTIMYAVIGLIVVALAQFIVRFVLRRVTDTVAGP